MKCLGVKRLLGRYIDKEITNARVIGLIEKHIAQCPSCRKEKEALLFTKELLLAKEQIVPTDDFLARLKNKIIQETLEKRTKERTSEFGNVARRLIPVPVTLILIVLMLFWGHYGNGQRVSQYAGGGLTKAIENYLLEDLSPEERNILSGHTDTDDLLKKIL